MEVKKKYALADFQEYAFSNIAEGFETISSSDFCEFEYKKSTKDRVTDVEGYMIRVGDYFYTAGAQQSEHYVNRIYFAKPFCYIAGPQNMRMNKFRQHGRFLVETIIYYLFLKEGYLMRVNNINHRDLLERRAQSAERMKKKQIEANEEDQAAARRFEKRKRAEEAHAMYIKQEPMDDSNTEFQGSQYQSTHRSIYGSSYAWYNWVSEETDYNAAKLERELQAVRERLEVEEQKSQKTETALAREKKRRLASEASLEKFRSKNDSQKAEISGLKSQYAIQAEETEEWKSKAKRLKKKAARLAEY